MTTKCGVTAHVGRKPAENGFHGIRFAKDRGWSPNFHLTISFDALGIGDEDAGRIFRDLRDSVSRHWRYLRQTDRVACPFVDVYAHANPAGSRHVHWMIYLPPGRATAFEAAVSKRLRRLAKAKDLKSGLVMKPAGGPGSLAKYIFRGVSPEFGPYFRLTPANEGLVTGRRTGVSRAIGKAARSQAGWTRKRRQKAA
jgi:hypothetical protein